jgi:hypothetical protein
MDNIVDNGYLKYYIIVYYALLYYFKLLLCGWLIC